MINGAKQTLAAFALHFNSDSVTEVNELLTGIALQKWFNGIVFAVQLFPLGHSGMLLTSMRIRQHFLHNRAVLAEPGPLPSQLFLSLAKHWQPDVLWQVN